MSPRWRIIDSGAMDPFANMALDEALLRGYQLHSSPPTLRIYRWKEPGISLGYSQDPGEVLDMEACRSASVPFVRRITGGGIILHDKELTYSLVCSRSDLGIPPQVASSYRIICSFLIEFYRSLGIEAGFASDAASNWVLGRPSALCSVAKEKYDIVVGERKIGGNAQKRIKDVIFQHGSIPLSCDAGRAESFLQAKAIDESDGKAVCLEELLEGEASVVRLTRLLKRAFTKSFNLAAEESGLSGEEEALFSELKNIKYGTSDWNYHRRDQWKDVLSVPRG